MTLEQNDRLQIQRDEIDRIDSQILDLLNQRMKAALEIGRVKKANNQPVYVPEREKAVIERLLLINTGPLPDSAVQAVFQTIIQLVRHIEESDHSAE